MIRNQYLLKTLLIKDIFIYSKNYINQEIFTKNYSNPDSDFLSPQYFLVYLVLTIRTNGDAPSGAKKVQEK